MTHVASTGILCLPGPWFLIGVPECLMRNDFIPTWRNTWSGSLRPICHIGYITEGRKEIRDNERQVGMEGAKEGQEQCARRRFGLHTALHLLFDALC